VYISHCKYAIWYRQKYLPGVLFSLKSTGVCNEDFRNLEIRGFKFC